MLKGAVDKVKDFVLSSSGEGFSLRLKSMLLGLSSLALVVLPLLGLEVTPESWGELVDLVSKIAGAVVAIVSGLLHMRGWADRNFRKDLNLGRYAK